MPLARTDRPQPNGRRRRDRVSEETPCECKAATRPKCDPMRSPGHERDPSGRVGASVGRQYRKRRLSFTPDSNIHYEIKEPCRDGTMHLICRTRFSETARYELTNRCFTLHMPSYRRRLRSLAI